MVQILKEYGKRTEYKVLEKFVEVKEVSFDTLKKGVFLIPAIILSKLNKEELELLSDWIKIKSNQLILTPAWKEIDLKDFFDISLKLSIIKASNAKYEGLECDFKIEGKVQDVLFSNDNGVYGSHYRKDTSCGLLTIITLPLLDYKLSHKHNELKELFLSSIKASSQEEEKKQEKTKTNELTQEHTQLFLLIAGGVNKESELKDSFRRYFNKEFNLEKGQSLKQDLIEHGFIEDEKISSKGHKFIEDKSLRSFIKVLKGGRDTNGW